MKRIISAMLLAAPAALIAQDAPFTVKGKVGKLNAPAKAYLSYRANGANVLDSAIIKKGSFELKGTAAGASQVRVLIDHTGAGMSRNMDGIVLYLDGGKVSLAAKDSVKNATVKGSKLHAEYEVFKKYLSGPDAVINSINTEYYGASKEKQQDKTWVDGLVARQGAAIKEKQDLQKQWIQKNPGSYFSLASVKEIAGGGDILAMESTFNGLADALKTSKEGKEFADQIEIAKKTSVGVMAPDFTQNDQNDKPVKLSDFRGKYVLIDFWASWCGPCRAENPNVVKTFHDFKDKNFTVLGVSLDQKKENWLKAIADDKLDWTQVSDLKFWNNEVAKQYGVRGIPTNLLIDPTGKIIAKNLRGEQLGEKLAEFIK